jgi:L-lactate utilization protein LutB
MFNGRLWQFRLTHHLDSMRWYGPVQDAEGMFDDGTSSRARRSIWSSNCAACSSTCSVNVSLSEGFDPLTLAVMQALNSRRVVLRTSSDKVRRASAAIVPKRASDTATWPARRCTLASRASMRRRLRNITSSRSRRCCPSARVPRRPGSTVRCCRARWRSTCRASAPPMPWRSRWP